MQILLTSEEKQLVKKIQLLKFLAILICFSWFMQKKKKIHLYEYIDYWLTGFPKNALLHP